MQYLDLTYPTAEENLACDEALLELCESGASGPVLRLWEPAEPFIVLGYSRPYSTDVYADVCAREGVPIFRRCSGGGTVLQGPGCLNFSLLLDVREPGQFSSLTRTSRLVAERHRNALQPLLPGLVAIEGIGDLTLDGKKFSGNAQRRKQRFSLYHGTLLLALDIERMSRLLPLPAIRPPYRGNKPHGAFVTNTGLPSSKVKEAIRSAWAADPAPQAPPGPLIRRMAETRYADPSWARKY